MSFSVITTHNHSAEVRVLTLHISCSVTLELIFFLKNKIPTWCHLLFYFTSYVRNMFRTLIYPSSGACDCAVELPHRSFCSRFVVCWRFGAAGFEWCPCCRLKHNKLLTMDILMSETCWVHKKWNKITNDIKLVFYSSTITMMHGPINIITFLHSLPGTTLLLVNVMIT